MHRTNHQCCKDRMTVLCVKVKAGGKQIPPKSNKKCRWFYTRLSYIHRIEIKCSGSRNNLRQFYILNICSKLSKETDTRTYARGRHLWTNTLYIVERSSSLFSVGISGDPTLVPISLRLRGFVRAALTEMMSSGVVLVYIIIAVTYIYNFP